MPQPMQLAQIVAKPPCGQCSTVTEDSKQTRCCKVTGYGCFYTNKAAVVAKCMKKCTPGNDALLLHGMNSGSSKPFFILLHVFIFF